jgi:wyosine [tRNA(Phe)-imidazoG37] synthetase (radical SAM superfamily)
VLTRKFDLQDTWKKIDRPLFQDYWPRFIGCLEALAERVGKEGEGKKLYL